MLTLLIIVILLVLIIIGVSIAISIGLTGVISVFILNESSILPMLAQRMYASATSFPLLAVPFFILAGNLMNSGGITNRIFRFARALVGPIPGGLGQVNIISNMIFSGMSGSAIADAVGLGTLNMKAMADNGYDRSFSAALTSSAACIGPVIPPSIPFVLYGTIAEVSIVKLFLAGFLPGILMGIVMMISVAITSIIRKYPRDKFVLKAYFKELFFSFIDAFLPLLTPVIIIGGIVFGIFTPTEASVVATLYAFALGFLYRELTFKKTPKIFFETVSSTVSLLFIIATAGFLSYVIIHQRIPDFLINSLIGIGSTKSAVIALTMVVVLILGFFIEGNAIFLITLPIFMPIIKNYGIDEVQFGVIMTLGMMLGNLTPPVGMCLFAVSRISKISIGDIVKEVWPYLIGIAFVWILIAYVPQISLIIPNLLK